ncbi:MAG: PEP-CTERM sorting domain-containing protein [Verrucomicrobiota bacterium]|nr:PEP-CTERM sorting domain-containing protein [Verrucomicrobiota bacterium]
MKKILIMASLLASVSLMAQGGTLMLANLGGGANAPVFDTDGVTKVAKNAYKALVYVAADENAAKTSTNPVAAAVTFNAAGYFVGPTVTLTDFAPGSKPWVKVEVFDAGYNDYNTALSALAKIGTATFQLGAGLGGGEPPLPAPGLVGMPRIEVAPIPEPSVLALVGLGVAAFLLRRRN